MNDMTFYFAVCFGCEKEKYPKLSSFHICIYCFQNSPNSPIFDHTIR